MTTVGIAPWTNIYSLVFWAIAGMFFHNINFLPLLRVIAFPFSKRKGAIAPILKGRLTVGA
ncbi:MAG: hypothetical protein V7K97_15835 [Nostoc sp.]|uniref:hypothetical protein n=1 Tax=Nostoc sp. TaxID=1180 RepID=UPI002FFAECA4